MNQIKTSVEHYGLDVAAELTKILSEQLAKEIDKDILKGLGLESRNKRRKNSIDKIFRSSE
jgi:hypothetical protein